MNHVRAQYKQTEIGLLPADWDAVRLETIGKPIIGLTYSPSQVSDSGTLVLRSSNVQDGKLAFENNVFVQMELPERVIVQENDILVCVRNGSRELIGKSALITAEASGSAFGAFMGVIRAQSPVFLNALVNSEIVGKQIDASMGATINQITNANLRSFMLPWPRTSEERELIAKALGDVDGLIAALEALIAKKRLIKEGAMQDLLYGDRRLPGFKKDWTSTTLGKVGPFAKGSGVRKDEASSGDIPCVRYGELYTHHHDIIRTFNSHISEVVAKTAFPLRKGDVLFAGSGETKEEIGKCAALLSEEQVFAGGDIVVLRPKDADSAFLGYLLNFPSVQRQKASKGQGDAVVHISATALSSIELRLPDSDEQEEIGRALLSMDNEIIALEAKLAKTRDLKQGMMQVLLTGEVRLV